MAKGKCKIITKRKQDSMLPSEPRSPSANPGYLNTRSRFKSHLKMLIENFKKDINNSLKEIQENIGQQVEALKVETQKSLKEFQ